MKSVLVMGGSYFIGKKVVEVLLEDGYDVTILNRGSVKPSDQRIKSLIADRNDLSQMTAVLKDKHFEYVVDISGLNKVQMEVLCQSLNHKTLKKFILISSSAVYDMDSLTIPFHETDTISENSIWTTYGLNKIESEDYLSDHFKDHSVDFIAIRPPYVYGEENYVQRESFIFKHLEEERPIIVPDVRQSKIQFIHSKDLALTVLALLNKETKKDMRFNVGADHSYTFMEWIKMCEKVVGKPAQMIPFDFTKYQRSDRLFFPFRDYSIVLDAQAVKAYHEESITFEEGLKSAYEWYKNEKDSIQFNEKVMHEEKEILQLILQ